ncbi:integrase, partial [Bacteroides thetaiotaomicron]
MIDSIIHRFTGMSSVVFSPLYHYQYSFSYLYFEVILYAAHHIMLYHYQH